MLKATNMQNICTISTKYLHTFNMVSFEYFFHFFVSCMCCLIYVGHVAVFDLTRVALARLKKQIELYSGDIL